MKVVCLKNLMNSQFFHANFGTGTKEKVNSTSCSLSHLHEEARAEHLPNVEIVVLACEICARSLQVKSIIRKKRYV
jgi:hypothetical protein